MKKILIISIFIFWLVAAVFFTAWPVDYKNNSSPESDQSNPINKSTGGDNLPQSQLSVITVQEVARHNKINDCWMIIGGKVYNLSSYLGAHPGSAGIMLPYCGRDGTVGFQTKDSGQPHSRDAQNLLVNYFVASLNGQAAIYPLNPSAPVALPSATEEDGFEND